MEMRRQKVQHEGRAHVRSTGTKNEVAERGAMRKEQGGEKAPLERNRRNKEKYGENKQWKGQRRGE